MRKDIETYELIEQYLNGNLSGDELKRVERLIKSDKEFAREVDQHRKIQNIIIERSLIDIKEQVKDIHQRNTVSSKSKFGKGKFFGSIGALVIIGTVLVFVLKTKDSVSPELPIQETQQEIEAMHVPVEIQQQLTPETSVLSEEKETSGQETGNIYKPDNSVIESSTESDNGNVTSNEIEDNAFVDEKVETELTENSTEVLSPSEEIKANKTPVKQNITKNTASEISGTTSKEDICDNVTIDATVESVKSCDNKASGEISIIEGSITGGTSPYIVSIDGGKNYYPQLVFTKLKAGTYAMFIQDINNCTSDKILYTVHSKDCSYEFAFAPDKGEVWEIPTNEQTGSIKIYSKTGQIIFQQSFDYPDSYYWNGRNNSGNELPMGAYMFILQLDGEGPLYGTVTIIR